MTLLDAPASPPSPSPRPALLALTTVLALALAMLVPSASTAAAPAAATLQAIVVTEAPRISSTVRVSRTVAATPTVIEAVDTLVTRSHQWFLDDAPVEGATSSMITPLAAHVGKTLKVRETLTADGYEPRVVWSQGVVVSKGIQTSRAAAGLTASTAAVGETIVMDFGGVSTRTPGMTITSVWTVDGTPVTGGTDFWGETSAYAPRPADVGKKVKVVVTFTLVGYEDYVVTSPELTVQPGTIAARAAVHGDRTVGSTVRAWTGDSQDQPPNVSRSFQWLRNGAPISGATEGHYTLTMADFEQRISFRTTASAPGYTTRTVTSPAYVVRLPVIKASTPVAVSGAGKVGAPLTAGGDTWSATPASRTAQWLRDGEPIAGATATTYTPVAADLGRALTVRVTAAATNHLPGSTTSEPVTIIRGTLVPSAKPRVSGAATVGSTLTAHPGTWPATTTTTLQWLRDGSTITGATRSTYRLTAADAGRAVSVRVSATAPGYTAGTATSAAVTVSAGSLAPTASPTISGRAKVGTTLTAKPGTWSARGATFTYQWLRSGRVVAGATKPTYRVTKADIGSRLTVRVTATAPDRATGTAVSKATAKVAKVTPRLTLSAPSRVKAGARAKLTIKVAATTVTTRPVGKVTITWGSGKKKQSKTLTLKAGHKGKITYRLPALRTGKHTITVRFTPTKAQGTHLTTRSLTRTLTAR